jgi:serine protease Do
MDNKKKIFVFGSLFLIFVLLLVGTGLKLPKFPGFPKTVFGPMELNPGKSTMRVVSEESITIDIVKKVTPAVVTVGITKNQPVIDWGYQMDPFGFGFGVPAPRQNGSRQIKQDIGSGFVVRQDGLIVTNKHVVEDTAAKYRVVTSDNKTFEVSKIYRDPNNDLAILKVDTNNLPTVELGDSDKLQVGQFTLAIGTALGEFRSTVTTGVLSGIGRNITAGSPYQGSEKLDNILQTSAAINPGNSGGPLLNSSGQVIGINVAVAADGQNIGFALPVNLLKDSLTTFENNGQFIPKAYLGVQYRMVTRDLAILNEVPEGAYVQSVVAGSPAEKVGLEAGDIITKIDGKMVRDSDGGLAKMITGFKAGQTVELSVFRGDNKTVTLKVALTEAQQ